MVYIQTTTSAIDEEAKAGYQTKDPFDKLIEWIQDNYKILVIIIIILLAGVGLICIICCCCCRTKSRRRRNYSSSLNRGLSYGRNTPSNSISHCRDTPAGPYTQGTLQGQTELDTQPSAPPMPSMYQDSSLPSYDEVMRHPAYQKT